MDDIAIVGMACLFPGAQDIKTYWQNIVNKVDAIGDPPADWGGEFYFDPDSTDNDRIYCKRGGYLGDISRFDPLDYGIIPISVDGAEPEHFLALRVAHEALKDAGFPDIPINRDRTEVILGRGTFINRGYTTLHQHGLFIDQALCLIKELNPEFTEEKLKLLRQHLKAKLPPFTSQTAPGLVSTIMSGRIANRLDLKGTNYTVDAACASSLIAVELAVEDLRAKKCDAVIAGGVQLAAHHLMLMVFCQLGALSRSSQIRPFDKDADGTLLGEGVGMVVLKRLNDAEHDGNRIYAVIKGVGSASDGKAKSIIAPRLEGEQLAIKRAYEKAGISPDTIGLIEAHGTSMPVGDVTEFQALSSIFHTRNGKSTRRAIGTVKSMIAHLIPASGMAGLIKVALALYHKVLPPTLHCENSNPQLEIEKSPFYINTETRPWIHGTPDSPRRAGVNAFGFGGINAHAIVEEYLGSDESKAENYQHTWDSELCVISGESRSDLIERCKRIQKFLPSASDIEIKDFAYTVNSTIEGTKSRLAIVGSSIDEIARKLAHALNKLQDPACIRIKDKSGIYYFDEPLARLGKLAFLFPGEGSQYINMLSDLCIHFPEVRHCFDILDQAFADHPRNYLPSNVIFPPPSGRKEERIAQEERIWQMEGAVDAVITADRALFRLFNLLGIQPHTVLGHSSGEFMSLEAAEAVEYCGEKELIQHIRSGNNAIGKLSAVDGIQPTSLLAVGAVDRTALLQMIRENHGRLFIAMDNCPNQVIICGDKETTTKVLEQLQAIGAVCQTLPFSRPYHTPMFEKAHVVMREFFSNLKIVPPKIGLYSCVTARPMPSDPDEIRKLAVEQWALQVRFRETIESMYNDGVRIFLEVGPNSNLTGFVNDILKGSPYLAVASNVHHRSGITQLNHALGLLAAHGVTMQLTYLYHRRKPRHLDIETSGMNAMEHKNKKSAPKLPLALPTLRIGTEVAKDIMANATKRHGPDSQTTTGIKDLLTSNKNSSASTLNECLANENVYQNLKPVLPQENNSVPDSLSPKQKVMKEYIQTMERFLDSQQNVMHEYLRQRMSATNLQKTTKNGQKNNITQTSLVNVKKINKMPFITRITSCTDGKELTAFREFDLDEDTFLMDHTLGREISVTDSSLAGLPIMPLTVSLEIMAEAAALLLPDAVLIGMKDIRAYKWIVFEEKHLTLKIKAKRLSDEEVRVQILESREGSASETPIGISLVEGIMLFSNKYPEPPPVNEFTLKGKKPSHWIPERLYTEGMLHGPCFRGVTSVDWWGEDGGEATLKVPPLNGFFRSQLTPYFVTDHVLLDAAGQIVAYWKAENRENDLNTFPFRIEKMYIYGPLLQPQEHTKCRVRIKPLAESQLRADMDIIGPNGLLHMRVIGWDDRFFDLPVAFHRARFRAKEVFLSESWPGPISGISEAGELECCRMQDYSDELLHAHGMVWLRVLAYLVLNRQEREVWQKLQGSKNRRIEWLLARVAAKDAIRLILKKRYGLDVCPTDIGIGSDKYGRPVVQGIWTKDVKITPSVSLAHKQGIGLALTAGNGGSCGIDMEFLSSQIKETSQIAFSEDERDLMRSCMISEDIEWLHRIWCAKEAVGKALGRGLHGNPQNLVMRELYPETGIVNLEVSGGLLQELPHLLRKSLKAYTVREGDLIVASAVYMEERQ